MNSFVQTFDGKLLAEPPEGVLLYVGQSRRILASAQVERNGIVFGKIGLLTQRQIIKIHRVQLIDQNSNGLTPPEGHESFCSPINPDNHPT